MDGVSTKMKGKSGGTGSMKGTGQERANVRIVIANDHFVMREGLRAILARSKLKS